MENYMLSNKPNFDSKIRQVVINGELQFSIFDVFALHDDPHNARRNWARAKKKLIAQGFGAVSNLTLHRFLDKSGRPNHPTPVANFNTFLRIAQVVDFKDWEDIRQYMADLAEQGFEEQAAIPESKEYRKLVSEGFSPEEAQQWLSRRAAGIETRKWITGIWRKRGAKSKDFAILTNQVSEIVHGKTATRRKKEMGLAKRDTMRNYDAAADQYLTALTEMTAGALHEWRDSVGFGDLSEDVDDARPIVDAARPHAYQAFSKKPRRLGSGGIPRLE
jgi:hypothetical protein